MPPFAVNKKAAFICSRWWEKWTLRVLDNFWVVWYIKGSCFFNTAAHGGAIQASCYPMTSKTNCTTMVFKKCCITTRTKQWKSEPFLDRRRVRIFRFLRKWECRGCAAMKAPVGLLSGRAVLRQQDGGGSPRQAPARSKRLCVRNLIKKDVSQRSQL